MNGALRIAAALSLAAGIAYAAPANGDGATGAAEAVFAPGATFAGVPLERLTLGYGVLIEDDGTAAGQFTVTLTNNLTGGAIVFEGSVDGMSRDGEVVTLTGVAVADGSGPAALPFVAALSPGSISLRLGGASLPAATLVAGSVAD